MPGEAGGTAGQDTTQSVPPNEKNAPVVNGNNIETLPRGAGKQVSHIHVYAIGLYCYCDSRVFVSGW